MISANDDQPIDGGTNRNKSQEKPGKQSCFSYDMLRLQFRSSSIIPVNLPSRQMRLRVNSNQHLQNYTIIYYISIFFNEFFQK